MLNRRLLGPPHFYSSEPQAVGPLENSLGSDAQERLRTQGRPLIRAERRLSGARRALKPAAACGRHTPLQEALQLPIAHRQPPSWGPELGCSPEACQGGASSLSPARGVSSHELAPLPRGAGGGRYGLIISLGEPEPESPELLLRESYEEISCLVEGLGLFCVSQSTELRADWRKL